MPTQLQRLILPTVAVMVALSGQVALAGTASAKVWSVPSPAVEVDPLTDLAEYENRVAFLVNKKRRAKDLKPVRYFETCVDRTSEQWSTHLADIGELVHRDLTKVLERCDLGWVGETLVRGTALLPGAAVRAWMESPPHRKVLMKPRASRAGVGTKLDAEGRLVTVLNFSDRD